MYFSQWPHQRSMQAPASRISSGENGGPPALKYTENTWDKCDTFRLRWSPEASTKGFLKGPWMAKTKSKIRGAIKVSVTSIIWRVVELPAVKSLGESRSKFRKLKSVWIQVQGSEAMASSGSWLSFSKYQLSSDFSSTSSANTYQKSQIQKAYENGLGLLQTQRAWHCCEAPTNLALNLIRLARLQSEKQSVNLHRELVPRALTSCGEKHREHELGHAKFTHNEYTILSLNQ